jgi:hypothetical protein
MSTKTVRIPTAVYAQAEDIQEDYDFATIGEAIRHMCQDGGYDV